MRTTINIDDNIFYAVQSIARQRRVSIGKVVSDLTRKALNDTGEYRISESNIPIFKVAEDSPVITSEDVKSAEDEE